MIYEDRNDGLRYEQPNSVKTEKPRLTVEAGIPGGGGVFLETWGLNFALETCGLCCCCSVALYEDDFACLSTKNIANVTLLLTILTTKAVF